MKVLSAFTAFALLTSLLLTGCASIISDSKYPVSLTSSPDGATVTITNRDGVKVYRGETPSQVTLNSGAGFFKGEKYMVKFEKEGCQTQVLPLTNSLDGWYIGNILFGGLIGILIVDPATGAMWKLPPTLQASLVENATTSMLDKNNVKIALIDDVPVGLRNQLKKVQ
jgi:hypothetical protein